MGKVPSREIVTYQRVFKALTEICPSPSIAKEMIERLLAYTKDLQEDVRGQGDPM